MLDKYFVISLSFIFHQRNIKQKFVISSKIDIYIPVQRWGGSHLSYKCFSEVYSLKAVLGGLHVAVLYTLPKNVCVHQLELVFNVSSAYCRKGGKLRSGFDKPASCPVEGGRSLPRRNPCSDLRCQSCALLKRPCFPARSPPGLPGRCAASGSVQRREGSSEPLEGRVLVSPVRPAVPPSPSPGLSYHTAVRTQGRGAETFAGARCLALDTGVCGGAAEAGPGLRSCPNRVTRRGRTGEGTPSRRPASPPSPCRAAAIPSAQQALTLQGLPGVLPHP